MNKKGQLSIETMIIYGLVILVTLSVIGGLLYFNVLDLGSYLPDKCDLGGSGDLKCEEMSFSSSSDTLQLGVRNIGQKPIDTLDMSVTDKAGIHFVGPVAGTATFTGASLAPGEIASVAFTFGDTIKQAKVLRGTLKTTYKFSEGAITQESSGAIRVKAS